MKKYFIFAIVALCSLTANAQKVKPVQYGGMCSLQEVVDEPSREYKIRVTGYGKSDALAQEDAEFRVIRMVLYTGVDGKCRPLLKGETPELDEFIDSKQYKDYISGVVPQGALIKDNGAKTKKKTFDITVRVNALDRYLRNKGLKKIGF